MKWYLSSYWFGKHVDRLPELLPEPKKSIGCISNAMDYSEADAEAVATSNEQQMQVLWELGIDSEQLDLQEYFRRPEALWKKLNDLGGIWVRGGNVFVLRQAMWLSGFDRLIRELQHRDEFLYAGYSAGVCVLAPDLQALQIVDDSTEMPYAGVNETIWEGLGLLNHVILPHYDSDHPESSAIEQAIVYCKSRGIPYQPLRDGEVIIRE